MLQKIILQKNWCSEKIKRFFLLLCHVGIYYKKKRDKEWVVGGY